MKKYRKIPPQLTDEELLSLTSKVLKKCGVENQTQAQFTYEICLEILKRSNLNSNLRVKGQINSQINSRSFHNKSIPNSHISSNNASLNPFYSLQPHPKVRKGSVPWNQAYSIVISFLKQFEMHTTLATVEVEFRNSPYKNIINIKPSKNLIFDDDENDDEYAKYIPGEEDVSFMENLTATEYISYLQRINDSIYNITGNYSYITNRGKRYQSRGSSNISYLDNSKQNARNLIPASFKEKVEEFTRKQNLSQSTNQNVFNPNNSASTSEVILDSGSFIKDGSHKNDSKLRYIDSANRLKEMANSYSKKKQDKSNKSSNNEIEIDIEL